MSQTAITLLGTAQDSVSAAARNLTVGLNIDGEANGALARANAVRKIALDEHRSAATALNAAQQVNGTDGPKDLQNANLRIGAQVNASIEKVSDALAILHTATEELKAATTAATDLVRAIAAYRAKLQARP